MAHEPQQFIGPIYCETGHPWMGMAEPVNTLTNLVIIAMAVAASVHLARNYKRPPVDALILVLMLYGVGFGSLWWHGWRTRIALNFDVIPGLLFLFFYVMFWIRRIHGSWAGLVAFFAVPVIVMGTMYLGRGALGMPMRPSPLMFVPGFGVIILLGLFFVWLTYRAKGRELAARAGVILGLGAAAAVFRSIDLLVCPVIPMGTHFLWHCLLATAAYLAIGLILRLNMPPDRPVYGASPTS
jgi:hypothetical protein